MGMNVRKNFKGESNFERPAPLEAGTYPAAPVQLIGLGLQAQRPFQGQEKAPKEELYITYELADEFLLDEDGNEDESKPRWISENFPLNNLDSDRAKSTQRYFALDPTEEHGGDFTKLLGIPCLLSLTHTPSKKDPSVVYNNVHSVQPMRSKDAKKYTGLVNEPKVFVFDEPDLEVFLSLPAWLQDKIKEALTFPGSELEKLLGSSSAKSKDEGTDESDQNEEEEGDGDDEEGW